VNPSSLIADRESLIPIPYPQSRIPDRVRESLIEDFSIRDGGFVMRDARFLMRDAGFPMRDAGFRIRDSGSAIRDEGFAGRSNI
jgi:hypothetical protein